MSCHLPLTPAGAFPSRRARSLLTPLCVAVAFSACTCETPPPTGEVCGAGTVDGADFAVVPDETRLVITVARKDGAGCGVFHSHAVLATAANLEYTLSTSDVGSSTVKVTVAASGLDPDPPELRAEFLPEGENEPLSEGDRTSIRGSVAEEVLANEHPSLVFTLSALDKASGKGTAKLKAEIAGAESETTLDYEVTKDGDRYVVKGTGQLDGGPHGIPRNSLGFCVEPVMDLHFDLVLAPGKVECGNLGDGPVYEPQLFPDDACAENVSYNEVRDVAVMRCAGCHDARLSLGATVPLVAWEDWRIDSLRNAGRPLYETAHELVHLDPADGLSMPPQEQPLPLATDLTPDELALFDAWVEDGARNVKCEGDPGLKTFPRLPTEECGDLAYDTENANGVAPRDFFDGLCAQCHLDASGRYAALPQISGDALEESFFAVDHDLGQAPTAHPYYVDDDLAPLSFWQTSVERVLDGSMPPGAVGAGLEATPQFLRFREWVEAGAPADTCDP